MFDNTNTTNDTSSDDLCVVRNTPLPPEHPEPPPTHYPDFERSYLFDDAGHRDVDGQGATRTQGGRGFEEGVGVVFGELPLC
tara:strand:+ start:539 stop:784 length:246 start_codon:yes stop_codon:yes gene_type:complete